MTIDLQLANMALAATSIMVWFVLGAILLKMFIKKFEWKHFFSVIGVGALLVLLSIYSASQPKVKIEVTTLPDVKDIEIKIESSDFIKNNNSKELEYEIIEFDKEQDKRIIENIK